MQFSNIPYLPLEGSNAGVKCDVTFMSELVAQLGRALSSGVCRAERPGFETQLYQQVFIGTFHLVLYQFALLF